jgi:hypothetical protein
MAKFALTNVRFFAGGADLTANSNKAELQFEVEDKDATAFSTSATLGTWHESLGGISSAQVNGSGQWDASVGTLAAPILPDDASFSFVGTAGQAVTVCPQTASAGALAYVGGFLRQNYTVGGSVGDVAPWTGTWQGGTVMGRGYVTVPPAAYTATGLGTGFQLPALAATDVVTATLHVLSATGTTPAVSGVIQSAAANTFASPTTRATFTSMSAQGGQVVRFTGSVVTDTWWRLSYTITGTTPSIVFLSAIGAS